MPPLQKGEILIIRSSQSFKIRQVGKYTMFKNITILSLLLILLSACTRSVSTPVPTVEQDQSVVSVPSSTPTPLFATATFVPTETPVIAIATVAPVCSEPARVQIGQEVTVVVEDWDKLKLRSEPVISPDTVIMELPQLTQLQIIDGPVCVADPQTQITYWFWQVTVIPSAEVGWIAEGEYPRYFIR